MSKREFQIENEYRYNRREPLRWVLSHMLRYPILPLALVICAVANNFAYSTIQIFVGRAFDVIRIQGFEMAAVLVPVFMIMAFGTQRGLGALPLEHHGERNQQQNMDTHARARRT